MHRANGGVEHTVPSDEETRAAVHAAIAIAERLATVAEAREVPAHVAVLAACWFLADHVLTTEVLRGIPTAVTRAAIDRQIYEAIEELRRLLLPDSGQIQ